MNDPTDPVGRLLLDVLAMFAAFESDLTRMRAREDMKAARAEGRLPGHTLHVHRAIQPPAAALRPQQTRRRSDDALAPGDGHADPNTGRVGRPDEPTRASAAASARRAGRARRRIGSAEIEPV
ncbi:MAG TPA: recombinase family protein, partial [Solirubrobacteraceae bacterium]|nr:recombinase family protein [Solirubrobacteraceae bacterium]